MGKSRSVFVWASLLLVAVSGCGGPDGPERAAVQGTVTFDGEPVPEGTIKFIPTEGTTGPTSGGRIEDGKFHITEDVGPVIGRQLVAITGQRFTGRKVDAMPPLKIMWDERVPLVPPKFSKNPQLVVEVTSGTNDFALELRSNK
jgi:hypothetical protein